MTVRQDLTAANSRIGNALVTKAADVAGDSFRRLGSWRDNDIDAYLKLIGPTLTGAKREAARSTVAFYKAMASLTGQDFTQPVITASDLTTKALRNGVDTSVVYRRPFVDMRTALANGSSVSDAIEAGARRAQSLASTEVQLARRNAGLKARNANDRIVGYVRTLTGQENCALCYVASTQRYTRGDLMPIHPGCDCGEMPIYGTQDPGQVIDEVRLDAVHENVQTRFGVSDRGARELDYRQIRVVEHGEMGPMLTVKGQAAQAAGDVGVEIGATRVLSDYTPDEVASLRTYGQQGYFSINNGLRNGFTDNIRGLTGPNAISNAKQAVKDIDSAMAKSFLKEDVVVYRGSTLGKLEPADILRDETLIDSLKGTTFREPGYLSTSKAASIFESELSFEPGPQTFEFEITAPKGSKAIDMVEAKTANPVVAQSEQELLFARDTKLKINDIVIMDSTERLVKIIAEVVND